MPGTEAVLGSGRLVLRRDDWQPQPLWLNGDMRGVRGPRRHSRGAARTARLAVMRALRDSVG